MNNLDDAEKFDLNVFSNEEALPDPEFKNLLKQETLKNFGEKGFFSNFSGRNYSVAFALASFVLFTLFIGYGIVSYNNIFNKRVETSNKTFTIEEKSKILENVIKNNTSHILQKSQAVAEVTRQAPAQSGTNNNIVPDTQNIVNTPVMQEPKTSQQLPVIVKPEGENYNYRYTKITSTNGPAMDKCILYGSVANNPIYESYEYFGTDESYSKNIGRDTNNNVVDYRLNTKYSDHYEYIEYRGGTFALKSIYNNNENSYIPSSYPVSYTQSRDTDIKSLTSNYFGQNAEIVGTTQIGDVEYYVIKSEYSTPCMAPESTANKAIENKYEPIIYLYYVNSQTFEVNKTEEYLNSQTEENLIGRTEITRTVNTVNKETLDKSFTFDYDVPIRNLDLRNIDKKPSADEVLKFFTTNNIAVVIPKNTELASLRIESENQYKQFYLDREFYMPGEKGDKLYSNTQEDYAMTDKLTPRVIIGYKATQNISSLAIYNNNITDTEIPNLYGTKQDIEIKINNTKINARLYTEAVNYPVSYTNTNASIMVIFEYNGYVYSFYSYGLSQITEFSAYEASIEDYSPFSLWVKQNF